MGHVKYAVLIAALATFVVGSAALAQVNLVTFSEGDVIRADDVNQNFESVASAVESVQGRVDTLEGDESREVRVTRADLVPAQGAPDGQDQDGFEYQYSQLPNRAQLELAGNARIDGYQYCFYTRLDLPDGATITEFAATLLDEDLGAADSLGVAYLMERAWTSIPFDTLASVAATSVDFQEVATSSTPLPHDVDASAHAYLVMVCLQRQGEFLGARVDYDMP